jgi:AmiR/NasT family two-component response regulator
LQLLQEALSSRSVIDQAIGIVMGQQRCDASTAFAVLRAASQSRNHKFRDIATGLVTSVGVGVDSLAWTPLRLA